MPHRAACGPRPCGCLCVSAPACAGPSPSHQRVTARRRCTRRPRRATDHAGRCAGGHDRARYAPSVFVRRGAKSCIGSHLPYTSSSRVQSGRTTNENEIAEGIDNRVRFGEKLPLPASILRLTAAQILNGLFLLFRTTIIQSSLSSMSATVVTSNAAASRAESDGPIARYSVRTRTSFLPERLREKKSVAVCGRRPWRRVWAR